MFGFSVGLDDQHGHSRRHCLCNACSVEPKVRAGLTQVWILRCMQASNVHASVEPLVHVGLPVMYYVLAIATTNSSAWCREKAAALGGESALSSPLEGADTATG